MDVTTVVKIISAFLAIIGVWRTLYDLKTGRMTYLRAEYDFSKKFLSDINNKDLEIHPYSLEKGYQAIAGNKAVKSDEVKYILSLENPVQCLKDYIFSKQLMEKIEKTGNLKLAFRKKYKKAWSSNWRKVMYFILYVVFSFIALSPFLLQSNFNISFSNMLIQLLFSIPFGGLYAWSAINAYWKIKRGEFLVENQEEHTKRIYTSSFGASPKKTES